MIGTMEFIRCAGSLMTSEYPLLTADSDMDQYVVQTYSDVHFIEDMKQAVTMPSFDGWSECNMVRFKESGTDTPWTAYYWITDAVRSSTAQGCTDFMLEFDAPTTLLKKGDTVNGQWLRSPVNFTPWKQQNVISGTMGYTSKRYILSDMDDYDTWGDTYWVSITATKTPDNEQGSLEIYGFPVILSDPVFADQSSGYVTVMSSGDYGSFPSVQDLINGDTMERMGLTASEIQDISITKGCPFAFYTVGLGQFYLGTNASNHVDPIYIKYTDGSDTKNSVCVVYHISGSIGVQYFKPFKKETDITLTEMEATCGHFNIIDSNGSCLASIPSNWIVNNKLKIHTEVVVDFGQIYWRISIIHPTSGITLGIFQINDTHLPYIGSQWDNYRAYSMGSDREALQFANEQAGKQAIATAVSSIASLNPLTIATTAASSYFGYKQTENANNFNQNLSERRVQAQPSNGYNINYGLGYIINTNRTPTALVISLPVGITESIFNEFVENFGYANEGEYEMPMNYGFYQGTIYTTPTMTGPRLVELINAMNAGIRMIKPSGNTKD